MFDRLSQYRRKRDFAATPEPRAAHARGAKKAPAEARFVVHLHHAHQRHFDLRLQVGDSLRSWAVPKGPSLDPRNKRLAVEVEDHPLRYGNFEGVIPQGQYGAGKVWIWDRGSWSPEGDPRKALQAGHLRFTLHGKRLQGAWSLIRTRLAGKRPQWLLIKSHDEAERRGNEADDVPLSKWSGNAEEVRKRTKVSAAATPNTRGLPAKLDLQLARLVPEVPAGKDWLHEIKFDGYRILIWRDGDKVRITSRGDQDWTAKLPATARAVSRLRCRSCILDGELVTLDAQGRSSFGLLQQRFGQKDGKAKMRAMLFDLLYLDGKDLRAQAQLERKQALAALLKHAAAPLQLSEYTVGNGAQRVREACEMGLEGIVSKAAEAPYAGGCGGAWLKIKCVQSDEYAIVGYTKGNGARAKLGSLLLATPTADNRWRYRGRVGTGFDERTIADLLRRLSIAQRPVPLENAPQRAQLRGATPIWVTPKQVVEVEFRGYTEEGLLRQASLKGVREDRPVDSLKPSKRDSAEVRSRVAALQSKTARGGRGGRSAGGGGRASGRDTQRRRDPSPAQPEGTGVRLTHPERVLFKDPAITKEQLANFYRGIADFVLPGLINRPLLLLRCPDGGSGECFFQKHITRTFPAAVREVNDRATKQRWIYIDGLEGLIGLVQMNAVEYHVWGSTVEDLERADRLVIDLDPGSDVPWKRMIEAALKLRERLAALQLQCFVRTSGGKGLHVVIPLRPAADWDSAKAFARRLAEELERQHPDRYLTVATKSQRRGRIFLDYLRNARGSTAVCSYSVRNRTGVPIATPLHWDELPRVRAGDQFRFATIGRRLARLSADPWADIDRIEQALPPVGG